MAKAVAGRTGRNLVVVESAAKAKTIEKFLGRGYVVRACFGHVRDLPKSKLGVDTDGDFAPQYAVTPDKKDVVKRLKDEAKGAGAVYLATDPDREGEAIAWHLVDAMGLRDTPVHRIVFHEITRDAILNAVKHPRGIDLQRVDAQQARRVLDRLVGYKISPLLWKKVRPGLSAGRVQSVAVRLVVDREREREAFKSEEYWSLDAELTKRVGDARPFKAGLTEREGKKLEPKVDLNTGEKVQAIVAELDGAAYRIREVRQREQQRHPAAPFTTSTLQQDASRKLSFTAKRTMVVAQQLYEGVPIEGGESVGLITYMRTDSVTVAETAIQEARRLIAEKYGSSMLPERPRAYKTRSKLAQEAHEAIRPTSAQREPEQVREYLTPEQFRLYDLVWKRFVASQMASAVFDVTTADVDATQAGRPTYTFRASGSVLRFAGFLSVYREGRDDDVDEDGQPRLPELSKDEQLDLQRLLPEQHFTQPPPRYTEATLVKALEERGIGRPSTYAPILSTIQDRGYVDRDKKQFKPTDLGLLVNDLLVGHFSDIVDVDFTANMEEKLDDIATGERPWVPVVREFYRPLEATLERAQREIEHVNKAAEVTDEVCAKCGKPMAIKLGRFGRFLSCTGFPDCKNAKPLGGDEAPPPEPSNEVCETCANPMVIKTGRFGRFLSCSDYPACKTTRPILEKIGLRCPKCGTGDLVAKKSRFGKAFYGCATYPKCDWVSWQRPLADPCDQCGGLRVPLGADRVHCIGCDGELPTRTKERAAGDGEQAATARRGAGRGAATRGGGRRAAGRQTGARKAAAPRGKTAGAKAKTKPASPVRARKAS